MTSHSSMKRCQTLSAALGFDRVSGDCSGVMPAASRGKRERTHGAERFVEAAAVELLRDDAPIIVTRRQIRYDE